MREFEKYIERHLEDKILHIDLVSVNKRCDRNIRCLNLGIKEREKHGYFFVGTTWKIVELDVEMDFSGDEFNEVCKKYNISKSIYLGESSLDNII